MQPISPIYIILLTIKTALAPWTFEPQPFAVPGTWDTSTFVSHKIDIHLLITPSIQIT